MYFLLLLITFSFSPFLDCKNINTCLKMCVNGPFMWSVKLLLNSRQWVIKFWESQKWICPWIFDPAGSWRISPLYCSRVHCSSLLVQHRYQSRPLINSTASKHAQLAWQSSRCRMVLHGQPQASSCSYCSASNVQQRNRSLLFTVEAYLNRTKQSGNW